VSGGICVCVRERDGAVRPHSNRENLTGGATTKSGTSSGDEGRKEMQKTISDPRASKMFSGDRMWSLTAIAVLWILYAFVFYQVKDDAGSSEVIWSLLISGGLVILFNTAAIFAMLFHLSEERDEIYGLDLHYLDLKKRK
jgi:hypothetical protein